MESQEIKDIYFGFYDQLIEPYCSIAKDDYNGSIRIPESLTCAINFGFYWDVIKKDRVSETWDKVIANIGRYLKENQNSEAWQGMRKLDMVNHPQHYGGDTTYEYFKVAEAWGWHKRAYLWNAGKYMKRTGEKDKSKEIEDLEKAIVYLNKEIELLKNGNL